MTEKNSTMLERIVTLLEKAVGNNPQGDLQDIDNRVPFVKQFQEEEMTAIEWLYPVDQDDCHGDRMDAEEVRKMVDSLNRALGKGLVKSSIDHVFGTDGWHIEKVWVNECECYIGDTLIPEGWPLAKTKFTNESLWEARKEGQLMGLSIGAKGIRETVE